MDAHSVAIIVPAWNEEKTIRSIVQPLLRYGCVIVVDDGSTDRTNAEAAAAGAVVVPHLVNKGYDAALNSGFQKAAELGCLCAITFDADGQHEPSLVTAFLKKLDEGCDLVLGVRPRTARLAEKIFSFYANIFFGIRDPLCGMKGYRMSLHSQRGWFDSYSSIGTELALWAKKQGARVAEINVPVRERKDEPRFGHVVKANIRIIRSLFWSVFIILNAKRVTLA